MKKENQNLLNIFVVISMMIQIVGFSFVMDEMSHGHKNDHALHHQLDVHQNTLELVDIDSDQMSNDENIVDECCSSPACGTAAISNVALGAIECRHNFGIVYTVSWHSISLPGEFKPPKRNT